MSAFHPLRTLGRVAQDTRVKPSTLFFARSCSLGIGLSGCHPPDREIYERSKECSAVLQTSLYLIPAARLRQAGLDRFAVDKAGLGELDDALKFGANVGLDRRAVYRDVDQARMRAMKRYADGRTGLPERKVAPLIQEVKQCLPVAEESNND